SRDARRSTSRKAWAAALDAPAAVVAAAAPARVPRWQTSCARSWRALQHPVHRISNRQPRTPRSARRLLSKKAFRVFSAVTALVAVSVALSAQNPTPRQSVWDGVYSDAQATRGERTY